MQYRCMESHISSNTCHLKLESSENERIASANYIGKYIEITFVEDWAQGSTNVESLCEFYQRKTYKKNILSVRMELHQA